MIKRWYRVSSYTAGFANTSRNAADATDDCFFNSAGSSKVIVQNGECTLYEPRPQSLMLLQVD